MRCLTNFSNRKTFCSVAVCKSAVKTEDKMITCKSACKIADSLEDKSAIKETGKWVVYEPGKEQNDYTGEV